MLPVVPGLWGFSAKGHSARNSRRTMQVKRQIGSGEVGLEELREGRGISGLGATCNVDKTGV